jgi:hypothetical protein
MNVILYGLASSKFIKFMHCGSTKEIWSKLQNTYEGNVNVKKEKLQTHRGQFENLKMKEEEDIVAYFLRVDEIVNTIKKLWETMDDKFVVKKVLRTLPSIFYCNVSTIEKMKYFDSLIMDKLHGILTTYEMTTMEQHPSKHKETFKVSKGTSSKGHQTYDSYEEESTVKEEKIIKRLKKGADKYKGKIPFNLFFIVVE